MERPDLRPRFVGSVGFPDFGARVLSGLEPSQDWAAQYIPKMLIGLAIRKSRPEQKTSGRESEPRTGPNPNPNRGKRHNGPNKTWDTK